MRAKIKDGKIEYFTQPPWILGDATAYANLQGYKELIYQTGSGGTYETTDNVVVEMPELELRIKVKKKDLTDTKIKELTLQLLADLGYVE